MTTASMTPAECSIWLAAFERGYLAWPNLAHSRREQIAAEVANAAVEGSRVQVADLVGSLAPSPAPATQLDRDLVAYAFERAYGIRAEHSKRSRKGGFLEAASVAAYAIAWTFGVPAACEAIGEVNTRTLKRINSVRKFAELEKEAMGLARELQRRQCEKQAA